MRLKVEFIHVVMFDNLKVEWGIIIRRAKVSNPSLKPIQVP